MPKFTIATEGSINKNAYILTSYKLYNISYEFFRRKATVVQCKSIATSRHLKHIGNLVA